MEKKRYIDMNDKERNLKRSKNYLRGQYLHGRQEIINYGREIENEADYSIALMEVIDRYVTLDKVI